MITMKVDNFQEERRMFHGSFRFFWREAVSKLLVFKISIF